MGLGEKRLLPRGRSERDLAAPLAGDQNVGKGKPQPLATVH